MSDYGVTPDDIRDAAFGVTIPAGDDIDGQLDKLIAKATMLLPTACIDARIAAASLDAAVVASVIEDMVVRVAKNPGGRRQFSIDDFSAMIDTALSSGALYLSDDERARLCPPSRPGRVGSVRIGVPAWRVPGGG